MNIRYVLLLRGINVGGKHKVVMAELKQQLEAIGLTAVVTYINSGNVCFDASVDEPILIQQIQALLAQHYPFDIGFALIDQTVFQAEVNELPTWWFQDYARKDVLFYLTHADKVAIEQQIRHWSLSNERIHFGQHAIFWVKEDDDQYLQTAYAKNLAKASFYKDVSIRNGKTFDKIQALLGVERKD